MKETKKIEKKHFTTRVDAALLQEFKVSCVIRGINISDEIQVLMRESLERHKDLLKGGYK